MLTTNIRWFKYSAIPLSALLLAGLAAVGWKIAKRLPIYDTRTANQSVRFPLSPPSASGWTTTNAYPLLTFFEPTCVAYTNDGSHNVFVLERRGTVVRFLDSPESTDAQVVLDISGHVYRTAYEDDGAIALALHPEFGQPDSPNRNYFFLLYTARIEERRFNRLSRFTIQNGQAGDELVLMDQLDENIWHNGGGLTFGPDGFLYVGVGDEGTNGDGLANGQRIDRDLYCGILRIDVDQRGGDISHPPVRQPESGTTNHYYIPHDNPFVGVPGALEEFWAHGLRNPYRAAFDPETGELWVTDVGHLRREEVNLIQKGGNYGWSYLEGSLPFHESYLKGKKPDVFHGTEQSPVWEYPHLNGDNCVIGGFVYRGTQHEDLQGKFLFADNGSGRVWALHRSEQGKPVVREILSLPVSSKTGIASVQPDGQGEPLLVILGQHGTHSGTIRRIVPAESNAPSLPELLSQTGLFSDLNNLNPNPGVRPYKVNVSQAAGEARIRRWLLLPGDGTDPDSSTDRIGNARRNRWEFPNGTVFVQHFDLPNGSNWKPMETRVLVRHQEGGVYALSYLWNEDGQDARLLGNAEATSRSYTDPTGQTRSWQFLDRQSCLACHNANAGFVLGVNTRQLNRNAPKLAFLGSSRQLTAWNNAGLFRKALSENQLESSSRLYPATGQAALNLKARSYLAVNCSSCHRKGGARAAFSAEFAATKNLRDLAVKPKQGDFGLQRGQIVAAGDPFRSVLYYRMSKLGQGRMPFVGAHELDRQALQLIRSWIESMAAPPEVTLLRDEREIELAALLTGNCEEDPALLDPALEDSSRAFALWQKLIDDELPAAIQDSLIRRAVELESPAAQDLFEWFVAPEQRKQRLGPRFDLNTVLQLQGNAERGRVLYQKSETLLCRKCHAAAPGSPRLGPDLAKIGARFSRSELLHHIVNPSARIDDKFATWVIETDDGKVCQGLLVHQDDKVLTLVDANGKRQTIAADSVEYQDRSPQSMMPANLLQGLTALEAADLLEFLGSQ